MYKGWVATIETSDPLDRGRSQRLTIGSDNELSLV